MKQSLALLLALLLAGLLSADILYTCSVLRASCRRGDCHRGHTEAVMAEMLGRLGELETEVAGLRAARLVTAGASD